MPPTLPYLAPGLSRVVQSLLALLSLMYWARLKLHRHRG